MIEDSLRLNIVKLNFMLQVHELRVINLTRKMFASTFKHFEIIEKRSADYKEFCCVVAGEENQFFGSWEGFHN